MSSDYKNENVFVGIDVSRDWLDVCVRPADTVWQVVGEWRSGVGDDGWCWRKQA